MSQLLCPRCREPLIRVVRGDHPRPTCAACGFVFFANPGVGAAVVIRNAAGQVLLVKRSEHQFGAGLWCFPCGFVEWGEEGRGHSSIPASDALMNAARLPATIARRPKRAISPRRSGARPPMPPIWMPMDEKFAKPRRA